MNKIIENIKEIASKYGFCIKENEEAVIFVCRDINGIEVEWIRYDKIRDSVLLLGNTDQCNLWFCETRPDLTPESIVQFLNDLNIAFEMEKPLLLMELIDPEDWQEIAKVSNAYEDKRYTNQ